MESRFQDAPWIHMIAALQVTLIGLGGIGSWTALLLKRLGVRRVYGYDDDIVEEHNMGSQLYSGNQEGIAKKEALGRVLNNLSGTRTSAYFNNLRVEPIHILEGTVQINNVFIVATDNIRSRGELFEAVVAYPLSTIEDPIHTSSIAFRPKKALFIDGRMTAEFFEVFAVPLWDREAISMYRTSIFDESERQELPCGFQQTSHTAAMIGSVMTSLLVNFASYIDLGEMFRPIPFYTKMDLQSLTFETTDTHEYLSRYCEHIYGYEKGGD